MKAFKIVATTDVHGCIFPTMFSGKTNEPIGLARLSSYLIEERKQAHVILIDNGDVNQGTALVAYTNKHESDNVMSKAFNLLDYDFINIGNHDFNYGSSFLKKYIDCANAKCITTNVLYDAIPLGYSQVIPASEDSPSIGLIGIVTDYIEHWERPGNLENLTILSAFESVRREVTRLRSIVDQIVVCYHGGLERDALTGEPTEHLTGENIGYQMATQIGGIDVIIAGHQHISYVSRVRHTMVIECAMNAMEFMELSWENSHFEGRIVKSKDYPVDNDFLDQFRSTYELTEKWLDYKLGEGEWENLRFSDVITAQFIKHPYISFLNQVQLAFSNADISFTAFFSTSRGFGKIITYRDILVNYPFPNTLVVKQMNGLQLRLYLEQNAKYWSSKDRKVVVNPAYIHQEFNYYLADGIEYTIKVANQPGQRISQLTRSGVPIEETDVFSVVMSNYLSSGGGNFEMIATCPIIAEYQEEVIDVVFDYILSNQPTPLNHRDNINVIYE